METLSRIKDKNIESNVSNFILPGSKRRLCERLEVKKENPILHRGKSSEIHAEAEPFDYFRLLARDEMFKMMLDGTNKKLREWAQECAGLNGETEKISMNELKTFIGLLLHMGTIQLNRMVDYWRVDSLFNISCFPLHMSRNRFLIILKSLQLSVSNTLDNITIFLDNFNETMDKIYKPYNELIIREPLVYTNGCLRKKHVHGKSAEATIFHSLTETTGITLHCLLTVEKEADEDLVLALMSSKLDKGYCVYLSYLYSSLNVAEKLLKRGTKSLGLLRTNCPILDCPLNFSVQMHVTNMNGILTSAWKQEREVVLFNTNPKSHGDSLNFAICYNNLITNDDHHDQLLSYYTCDRRPMQLEKKIGIHVIQLMLMNAFYMYSTYSEPKMTLYDFRLSVIRKLLSSTNPKFEKLNPEAHFPARLKPDERGKARRKKCRVCYQNGKRRDSLHYCPSCPQMPGLCLDNCFLAYHQLLSTHS